MSAEGITSSDRCAREELRVERPGGMEWRLCRRRDHDSERPEGARSEAKASESVYSRTFGLGSSTFGLGSRTFGLGSRTFGLGARALPGPGPRN
jgi:hypothetical protein